MALAALLPSLAENGEDGSQILRMTEAVQGADNSSCWNKVDVLNYTIT
jgi:hypothetical protein